MLGNSLFLSFLLSSALFVSSLVPAALQSGSTVIHKIPDCVSLHCEIISALFFGCHSAPVLLQFFHQLPLRIDLHPWEPPLPTV